jgi:hypothetical protein
LALIGAERADGTPVLDDIGNQQHERVGVRARRRRIGRRPVQAAEARAERHQPVLVQPLPAEAQHEVLRPGLQDRRERARADLLRQVHAPDIGAERPAQGHDPQC